MPDIDIDFDDRRRGEMIRYATDKYGADKVAQVITFGTIKTKAAIKDSARVHFGQPGYAIADKISKALPPPIMAKDIPLSGIVDSKHERYGEAAEVRALVETDEECKTIFETARGLEGLIRNAGVHACAVIMSCDPLTDAIPLWQRDDGSIITGWDYPSCEAIGLLKMDFLGLRNLTVIGDAIDNIKTNRGIDIDLDTLGVEDPETYKLLARGDTLGVFQLDGGPMRDLLRRMEPTVFDDIVAVGALYRPGPMGMNAHNDYADRKNNRQKVKPIHPELDEPLREILADTYGLIVYQEQIMHIGQKVAGYTMGRADVLRRAMGKKKKEVLDLEYEGFEAGMKASDLVPGGFSAEAVKALWDTILPFAGYAFNKSHAAAYGLVSYWTAYLKANFTAEYMAALLTSVGDNKDKSAVYLSECRRLGIKVLPPDVNESALRFAAVGEDIRFGLGAVRNVGANVVESIIKTREEKGKYASFIDFLDKSELVACNKRVIESLIKAGGFDSLGHTRLSMIQVHEDAVEAVVPLKRQEAMGQFDLFGFGGDDDETAASSSPLAHLKFGEEEYPRKQLLAYEREMLGLYVSAHPLDGAERILRKHAPKPIAGILADPPTRRRDRHLRADHVAGAAGQQEGRALGDLHGRGHGRLARGALLPEVVRAVRERADRRQRGAGQGPGQLARRQDVDLRRRSRDAGPVRGRHRQRRRRAAAGPAGRGGEDRPVGGQRAAVHAAGAQGGDPGAPQAGGAEPDGLRALRLPGQGQLDADRRAEGHPGHHCVDVVEGAGGGVLAECARHLPRLRCLVGVQPPLLKTDAQTSPDDGFLIRDHRGAAGRLLTTPETTTSDDRSRCRWSTAHPGVMGGGTIFDRRRGGRAPIRRAPGTLTDAPLHAAPACPYWSEQRYTRWSRGGCRAGGCGPGSAGPGRWSCSRCSASVAVWHRRDGRARSGCG